MDIIEFEVYMLDNMAYWVLFVVVDVVDETSNTSYLFSIYWLCSMYVGHRLCNLFVSRANLLTTFAFTLGRYLFLHFLV